MKTDKYKHISDTELLESFYLDHDNQWLGILLQRYTLLLFGVCMKYLKNEEEAKDSVQQIFLKALTELKKYKVDYFKSWIYMVTKNYCLMKLRDRQGKITADLNDDIAALDTHQDQEDKLQHLQKNNTIDLMNSALQELSEEQKNCLVYFYLEKKSYQQIAAQTGFSLLQVKSYIQNGKRNLKNLLEKRVNQK